MEIFYGTIATIDCRQVSFPVYTDACTVAGGAFHQGDFVYKAWSANEASLPINYLEVLALEPAVRRWAPLWRNKKVFIHTDDAACANSHGLITIFFWLSAIFNFRLKCVYYPGDRDKLGDAVSRLHEPNRFIILKRAVFNCGYF